jgi:hypothetical protein
VYGLLPSNGCFCASTILALSKYATVINAVAISTSQKAEYHDINVTCNEALSISDHTKSLKETLEPNGFHEYCIGEDVEGGGVV